MDDDLTEADREALGRALALEGVPQVEQQRAWFDRASAAAYHLQFKNLRLKPWESPPMYGDVERPRAQPGAAELLARLLAANLSRYEPDPIEALARVEAAKVEPPTVA